MRSLTNENDLLQYDIGSIYIFINYTLPCCIYLDNTKLLSQVYQNWEETGGKIFPCGKEAPIYSTC